MNIARRTQVRPLSEVWKSENAFSDWLITDDGLGLIAEDIGISIEEPHRESRGADFRCDIVGHLLGDPSHAVVIENQYGKTDHDHLGKMLTYAAVHTALTAIWIAERVADDHRSVVDWLNANTPESVSFYLAELKAYRIGDSPVAPQLDVLCRPNYTVKATRSESTPAETERRAWRKVFWEDIHAAIAAKRPPFRLQTPSTDHWSNISVGRSGFHVELLLTPRKRNVGLSLLIDVDGWKDAAYEQLLTQKDAIELEIGEFLEWIPMPDKQSAKILLECNLDPDEPINRSAIIDWFAEFTERFVLAFRDRVRQLSKPLV